MKKLLLSSLMMFAVCGYVTAQNATDSKFKNAQTTTTSAAPTPQKAAVTNDVVAQPATTSTDKAAEAVVPAANDKAAKIRNAQSKPVEATAISADGVVSNTDLSPKEKEELRKMEAAKAAAAKKNN